MNAKCENGKNALVVGGQGFLGYSIAQTLINENWNVRVLDVIDANKYDDAGIQIITGNVSDKEIHHKALVGIDTVFYFVSHSVPGMNHQSLEFEIKNSLECLDSILSSMVEMQVPNIVFPSSGGTIYGNVLEIDADEGHNLEPQGTYGQGKFLSEEIIKFYHRKFNITYLILRISNVYGCNFPRKVQQGVIDIFIQNILSDIPITIWGDADKVVRDYIFIDDVCNALGMILQKRGINSDIYNIGTGQGHSLNDIISIIEKSLDKNAIVNRDLQKEFGVRRNVLNIDKIISECSWYPRYSLTDGINETIIRKTLLG